ncbi:MAG: hypothetical protein WKF80_11670, partial [Thermomicrobiales bacterium]
VVCLALVGGLPAGVAAQATGVVGSPGSGDTAGMTIFAQVGICADDALAGRTVFLTNPTPGIDYSGCRLATAGEVELDLYASATAAEDRGTKVASGSADASGTVTLTYDGGQPYVYLGQGEQGAGGQFSVDLPADVAGRSVLVLSFTGGQDPVAPPPTMDSAVVTASVAVCVDAALAGTTLAVIDDPLRSDRDLAGCRPASEGEYVVSLRAEASVAGDGVPEALGEARSRADGTVAFEVEPVRSFVSVAVGDAVSPVVSLVPGQRVEVAVVAYVEPWATGVTIEVRRFVCVDPARAGTLAFYPLDDAALLAIVPASTCRPARAGEATIGLYASPTPVEDQGTAVTAVATTAEGYAGFTYTANQPFIYVGEGKPGAGGSFSRDIAVDGGDAVAIQVLAYVAEDPAA